MVSRLRSMGSLVTILLTALGIYALITGVFLLSENRRPESTFAWLLVFIFLPVIGLVVYLFFGRSRKAFSQARDFMAAEYRTGSYSAVESAALPPRRTNRDTGIEEPKSQEADVAGQAQLPFGFDHAQPGANPAKRRRVLPQPHRRYESCGALHSSPILHLAFG